MTLVSISPQVFTLHMVTEVSQGLYEAILAHFGRWKWFNEDLQYSL